MRSFTEIAEDYRFAPIRGVDGDLTGYVHLDGPNSKVSLNSKGFHHLDEGENGWFDLEIEDHRGRRLLLHNALTQSKSMPGVLDGKRAGTYVSDIFPNTVIIGAENLRKDRTILGMSFEIEGAKNFFVYNTIEWRSFYSQDEKQAVLKAIREGAWKPPKGLRGREYVSDPDEIYVVHRPKKYLNFKIEDMSIEVWHSRSQRGLGWTGHEIKVTPIISVAFQNPISVDDAIERVWRIKGFFDQLALDDLQVLSLTFSKFKKGWPSADVYLSNEAQKTRERRLDLHPMHVPFSRWNERKQFQEIFSNWLSQSQERDFFRAAIRLSLIRLSREDDPTLITLLMAGIESLNELAGQSGLSKKTINRMACAAHQIEPSTEIDVIKGLLGGLRRTSPKQRLLQVCAKSLTDTSEDAGSRFATAAVNFRNQIAHGRGLEEIDRGAASEMARALCFLCVAYDLETSGMPAKGDDEERRNLLATSRMEWAWQGFKIRKTK